MRNVRKDSCLATGIDVFSSCGFDVRQYFLVPSGQQIRGQQSLSVSHVCICQKSSAKGSLGHFLGIKPNRAEGKKDINVNNFYK